jgi:antitoxin (DNA-binding transcriptional repressor) of toxin-antitoxin stability system
VTIEDNIRQLVRWNSADAEAVAAQLLERVRAGQKQGLTMGVVVCLVHAEADGKRCYEPAFSKLPVEVSAWAAKVIQHHIDKVNDE